MPKAKRKYYMTYDQVFLYESAPQGWDRLGTLFNGEGGGEERRGQGWSSGESARLLLMWPGFDSRS